MTRLFGFALIASLVFYVMGHGLPSSLNPARRSRPVVVTLGDGSCDASAYSRRQAVRLLRTAIHDVALQEGTVLADTVQSNAETSMTFDFRHDFLPSPSVAGGLDQRIDADLEAQAASVARTAPRAFDRTRVRCGTDLFGAFQVTANALTQYPGRPHLVVVVSNMLEVGPETTFIHRTLTDDDIAVILAQLHASGEIPNLSGARIAVVGAGLDPAAGISKQEEAGLRSFWGRYFKLAGADIVAWQPDITDLPLG